MKHFVLLILTIMGALYSSHAQQPNPYDPLPSILPPSPDAAAVQRYGETEVDLFKGQPSISIPIYALSSKNLSIPISLSYSAGGFRVSELSTAVGLGWNLNLGGTITRNIRGQSDFKHNGRVTPDIRSYQPDYNPNNSTNYTLAKSILDNNFDTEPDIFSFNFLGRSGKFLFNDNLTQIYTIPHQKLEIQMISQTAGFTIKDEAGIVYYFDVPELSHPTEQCTVGTRNLRNIGESISSSWHLSKIIHPLGDTILFEYEDYMMHYREGVSEVRYKYMPSTGCGPYTGAMKPQEKLCTRSILQYGKRISKITIPNIGQVQFYYQNLRQDVDYYSNNTAKSLDSIVIRNEDRKINKFTFHYDYFISPGIQNETVNDQFLMRRLKLVQIDDEKTGSYNFNYIENKSLPGRLSNAQDMLGYTGSGGGNGSFIPCGFGYANCAQRQTNPLNADVYLLSSVQYPTRGKSKYLYEPNKSTGWVTVYDTTYNSFGVEAAPEELVVDSVIVGQSSYGSIYLNWSLPQSEDRLEGSSHGIITKPDGSTIILENLAESGSIEIPLMPGKYKIRVSNVVQYIDEAYVSMLWINNITSSQVYTTTYHSGVRIKEIIDSAGYSAPEMKRTYSYVDPNTNEEKMYDFRQGSFFETVEQQHCDYDFANIFSCSYIRYSNGTVSPYGIENDNQFGYKYVTVSYSPEQSVSRGYERFTFATIESEMDSLGEYSQYLYFGKLLSKETYGRDQGATTYRLYSKENNRYAFLIDESDFWTPTISSRFTSGNERFISSMKLKYASTEMYGCGFDNSYVPATFEMEAYVHSSFSQFDNYKEVIEYPTQATLTKNSQILFYDNSLHDFPTRSRTVNSTGDTVELVTRYIMDYSIPSSSEDIFVKGIIGLKNKHFIQAPVEKITYLHKKNGDVYVLIATLTTYKSNLPLPDIIYITELASPVPADQFIVSYIDASGNFIKDARYKAQAVFAKYTMEGNISEQRKINSTSSAYLWDYKNIYPVAEILNADSSSVAYTSFEAGSNGNWNDINVSGVETNGQSITGKKYYQLASSGITKSNLPSQQDLPEQQKGFIVSYWSSNGSYSVTGSEGSPKQGSSVNINGILWTYYEHLVGVSSIVNSVTVSGSGKIDEVRLYPRSAQMVTYTYDPLVGITSVCDANGRANYYEYDGAGRLIVIRDQNRNIVKTFEYQFNLSVE